MKSSKKLVAKPSQKFMGLLIDYNESGGSDNAMLEYVAGIEAAMRATKFHLDHYSFTHDDACPAVCDVGKCDCEADGNNKAREKLVTAIGAALGAQP